MIARNLHNDDFAAFVKILRREVHQKIEDNKRDYELIRNAIELWEQSRKSTTVTIVVPFSWKAVDEILQSVTKPSVPTLPQSSSPQASPTSQPHDEHPDAS